MLFGHPVPAVRARAVAGLRLLDVACTEQLRSLREWLMARIGPELPRHTRVAAVRSEDTDGTLRFRARQISRGR